MTGLLAIHWDVSPYIITIGSLGIRWYSLMFIIGFTLGYLILKKMCDKEGVPSDKVMDPMLYALVLATIIGARLGHCCFYQPEFYFGSWAGFWEIFMPWRGGLASHGGAIACVLAMWWFANKYGKKYDFSFLWVMDRLVIVVCFVGALIRLGNLFNSEIYGDVTSLPWGFIFDRNGETQPKHPTQLYEALAYTIIGFALLATYRKKLPVLKEGTIFGIFLIALFGVRFLVEFIKEPQVEFENSMALDMGQWLSVPFVVVGIVLLVWSLKKAGPAKRQEPQRKKSAPTHYARGLND